MICRYLAFGTVQQNAPFEGNGFADLVFQSGRLRISRDGALLFATVNGGLAVYVVTP